jgi:hypothetical protein
MKEFFVKGDPGSGRAKKFPTVFSGISRPTDQEPLTPFDLEQAGFSPAHVENAGKHILQNPGSPGSLDSHAHVARGEVLQFYPRGKVLPYPARIPVPVGGVHDQIDPLPSKMIGHNIVNDAARRIQKVSVQRFSGRDILEI